MKKFIAIIVLSIAALLVFPKPTSASLLYLTPSTGKLAVGDELTVTVFADTQGKSVNIAESNISFTSDTLELLDVQQGSTFLLPTPGSPNKDSSSVYFGGGLPNPGYNGISGVLGTMKFRAKAPGHASVNITRGNILLNDGAGTKDSAAVSSASFIVTAPPVGPVTVSSSTHPLQDAWSKNKGVSLNWTLPERGYGVSYSFDQNPAGEPDDTIDATSKTSINYPEVKDGAWYFHIKARAKNPDDPFGPTATYKIQIDTTPPLPFNIDLLGESDKQNVSSTPTVKYQAQDATSGVSRYDVYLDNKLVKELASSPFAFSKQEIGIHTIKVIAYDRAGNGTTSELPLNIVLPGPKPVTFEYIKKYLQWPLYGLIALNLLVFLFVGIMVRQNKKQNQRTVLQAVQIQSLQEQISSILEFEVDLSSLKRQIDVRFMDMARNQTQRLNAWQAEVDARIEREIDRNLSKIKDEINQRLAEARNLGPKQYEKVQEQVWQNISNEFRRNQKASYAKNDAAQVKVEVLRRLYEEYTNNKI
jgi:hypothetical protein